MFDYLTHVEKMSLLAGVLVTLFLGPVALVALAVLLLVGIIKGDFQYLKGFFIGFAVTLIVLFIAGFVFGATLVAWGMFENIPVEV